VIFMGPHAIYNSKPAPEFGQSGGVHPPVFYLEYPNDRPISSSIRMPNQPYGWTIDTDQVGPPLYPPLTPGISQPAGGGPTPRVRSNAPRNSGPDSIEYAVRQLGGTVLRIDSPLSFARALLEIREKVKATP
jgi:hypothetical protein